MTRPTGAFGCGALVFEETRGDGAPALRASTAGGSARLTPEDAEEVAAALTAWVRTATAGRDRPRIVVLCGSTKFKREFEEVNRRLTLAGMIVVAPGVFGHADGITLTEDVKARLDGLHLRKIDLADWVYVVSPNGYIGDSTRGEIGYAEAAGKPIMYSSDPDPWSGPVPPDFDYGE